MKLKETDIAIHSIIAGEPSEDVTCGYEVVYEHTEEEKNFIIEHFGNEIDEYFEDDEAIQSFLNEDCYRFCSVFEQLVEYSQDFIDRQDIINLFLDYDPA